MSLFPEFHFRLSNRGCSIFCQLLGSAFVFVTMTWDIILLMHVGLMVSSARCNILFLRFSGAGITLSPQFLEHSHWQGFALEIGVAQKTFETEALQCWCLGFDIWMEVCTCILNSCHVLVRRVRVQRLFQGFKQSSTLSCLYLTLVLE